MQDIILRAFTDGDDAISLLAGHPELPGIDLGIDPMIILRMTEEDQVMNGHHAFDSRFPNPKGQFPGQPMEEVYPIPLEVVNDPFTAPKCCLDP